MMLRLLFIIQFCIPILRVISKEFQCVKPEWFKCDNGECISYTFQCDGETDCSDHSDEKNCFNFTLPPPSVPCTKEEFTCKDNTCIPIYKFCDMWTDCSDGSDEYIDCVKKKQCKNFLCHDGYCINDKWVCDGIKDCPDGSDEINCGDGNISAENCTNDIDHFLCKNQRCISLSLTCNQNDDCGDNSDEDINQCAKSKDFCLKTHKCDHNCRATPLGPFCSCWSGYQLINDSICEDINECEIFGSCSQYCINSAGSYTCSCDFGYVLEKDRKSCKADASEALMFLVSKTVIRGYYIESEIYYTIHNNLKHAIGVAVDDKYIYWTDLHYGEEAIFRSDQLGYNKTVIVTAGLSIPEGIAADWITGNIYFTDSKYKHIGVCNKDGTYCTILITKNTDKPRAIVVSPKLGLMYWSDWGLHPHIAMASMDGKNHIKFIKDKIYWPNGLTIDDPNGRLYWVDAKSQIIESIRLDGRDRRTILVDMIESPYSIAVHENTLYWSDKFSKSIMSCNKFTGKDKKILFRSNEITYGIHIYHSVLKPKIFNPCKDNPCSQICLLNSNSSYTCACSLDTKLAADNHACRVIKNKRHIIVAGGNTLINYYHELLGKPKMSKIKTIKHITALTYDSIKGDIFINDQLTNAIYRYNISSDTYESIITTTNEILGGMDFDFVGNNLYWSDFYHKTIEVHSFNTKGKTVFYFQEEPHDISLDSQEGMMYVVFRSNDTYHIHKLQMNGLGTPITLVDKNIIGPKISLRYDSKTERLFWADQGTGNIESISKNGKHRYIFRSGLLEPMSLTILEENIFWTERLSKNLYWGQIDKDLQVLKKIPLELPRSHQTMYLVAMQRAYYNNNKQGCRKNNGQCSHVCLPSKNNSYICACPPGMMLNHLSNKCIIQTVCASNEIKCSEHDLCIKAMQLCDGKEDCPNGEDEQMYCSPISLCDKNQFTCRNGECVNLRSRCNSFYDCKDRSDEENCTAITCRPDFFQCHDGQCIEKDRVCDGNFDCLDYSDELNCNLHTCSEKQFMCNDGLCISSNWFCDGDSDCNDNSDEENCEFSCKAGLFKCSNNKCIDPLLICNEINDCGDLSDENNEICSHEDYKYPDDNEKNEYNEFGNYDEYENYKNHRKTKNCSKNEFKCRNTGECIPKSKICDGQQDCFHNDDESDCPNCKDTEYTCENKNCIQQEWICDKVDDCGDNSDEMYCDGSLKKISKESEKDCKEFRCNDGKCLPFYKVCDNHNDCVDGSDELKKCMQSCRSTNPCQQTCNKTPYGPICTCRSGFKLASDGVSCDDINECEKNMCSQICYNTPGGFQCSCESGYVLEKDKLSCKASSGSQMAIIMVAGYDVRKTTFRLDEIEVIYHNPNFDINGLDFNAREGAVYLSNVIIGIIIKINLKTKESIIIKDIGKPGAIASDWITNNIYFFNDVSPYGIKACNIEENKCTQVLTINGNSTIKSIKVDPTKGLLFWSQTEWLFNNKPKSKICRSSMDGKNIETIVTRYLGIVQKLTIDHRKSRLYWGDTYLNVIESIKFDGSDREIFLETVVEPLDVNVHDDHLYWLLSNTGNIKKCKLNKKSPCTTIVASRMVARYFSIYHENSQPIVPNKCQGQKCAYMCLLNEHDYTCFCPYGATTNRDLACVQNVKLFVSSNALDKHKKIHNSNKGIIVAIAILSVTIIIILTTYFYYQQFKINRGKKNEMSIHFLNPTYDAKDKTGNTFKYMEPLSPGEHEYTNPIINISIKSDNNKKTNKVIEIDNNSESETESMQYAQNIKLIR